MATSIIQEMGKANAIGTYTAIPVNTNFTAPSDGYFFVGTGNTTGTYGHGLVNGQLLMVVVNFSGITYPSQTLFVRKGAVLRAENNADARFYPFE